MSSDASSAAAAVGDDRPVALELSGLSKMYRIYDRPADRLKQMLLSRFGRSYGREFWALRDISFTVRRGDTVGIIGRNGAGKSTLLQILCGTLAPTTGRIETRGRIAALLELGSGFNPEFTGRENVYLNGTVLGLTRDAIDAKFADIAAFADIGQFLDQPVKTYSSGMMVRLAFAVVAHVDADILIVDEALAVGDAIFVQKCMRFIRAFQSHGTLLFVSHDAGAVQNLCQRAIWLDQGRERMSGPSKEVAEHYLRWTLQAAYGGEAALIPVGAAPAPEAEAVKPPAQPPDYGAEAVVADNMATATGWKTGGAELVAVTMEKADPVEPLQVFQGGERVRLAVRAKALADLAQPIIGFTVRDRLGQELFGENTLPFTDLHPRAVAAGREFRGEFVFRLPMLPNGEYAVMASVADGSLYKNVQHHWLGNALIITVNSSKVRWGLVGIAFERAVLETGP